MKSPFNFGTIFKSVDAKLTSKQEFNHLTFWIIFFICTWFTLFNSIVAFDLWWHIASGRFLFENGVFPPIGSFSDGILKKEAFSFIANSSWGDLLLFIIHKYTGLLGLQIFKILIVLTCVLVFLYSCNWKRNIWSLGGSVLIVVGMNQLLLIKNALFSLFFLALIALIWIIIKKGKFFYIPLYCLIPLSFLWTFMHGSVLLGIFVIILLLSGFGLEVLLKKGGHSKIKLIHLAIILISCYCIVNPYWKLNLLDKAKSTLGIQEATNSSKQIKNEKINITQKKKPKQFKDIFRILFKSGSDESFVSEYSSPLDAKHTTVFWSLVIIAIIFIHYLFASGRMLSNISITLPSLFIVFISFGYLRTSAFPFCFALPLITYGLMNNNKGKQFNQIYLNWTSRIVAMIIIGYFIFMTSCVIIRRPYAASGFYGNEPGIGNSILFNPRLCDWVIENLAEEKVYNSYSLGGYLIWKWYLKKKVLMDGRSIAYNRNYFYQYLNNGGLTWNEKNNIKYALLHMSTFKEFQLYFNKGWIPIKIDTSACLFMKVDDKTKPFAPEFMFSLSELQTYDRINEKMIGAISYLTLYNLLKNGWAQTADQWMKNNPQLVQPLIDSSKFLDDSQLLAKVILHIKESSGLEDSTTIKDFFHHYVVSKDKNSRILSLKSLFFYGGKIKPTPIELIALENFQPNNKKVLATLGVYFNSTGEYKKALIRYRTLLQIEPQNPETHYQMASSFHKLKQYDDALNSLNQSISYIKKPLNNYIYKSIIYFELKQYKNAKEMIAKILKINPEHTETLRMQKIITDLE